MIHWKFLRPDGCIISVGDTSFFFRCGFWSLARVPLFSLRYLAYLHRLEIWSLTFTANGKRQKLNFCRLSSALCTVDSRYLYLQWIVRDTFLILYDLFKGNMTEKNRKTKKKCLLLFTANTNILIPLYRELKTDGKSFIFSVCRLP